MKTIIIDGIEYVPKENKIDREPIIFKKTLHFEMYCEDLKPSSWNNAIGLCSKLGDGWRLPTILELHLMYESKDFIGNLKDTVYWSSTGYFASYAWGFGFDNGSANFYSKSNPNYVRAVRSITI